MLCLLVDGREVARPHTRNSKGYVGTVRDITYPIKLSNVNILFWYHLN